MKKDIIQYGQKELREVSDAVESIDSEEVQTALTDLLDTFNAYPCLGLSAPQIGYKMRIIIVRMNNKAQTIINPVIKSKNSLSYCSAESCFSLYGLEAQVWRPQSVVVTGLDVDGKELEISAEFLEARSIFHEIDHLDGVLFIDRTQQKVIRNLMSQSKSKKINIDELYTLAGEDRQAALMGAGR